jgi:hypothetical protein
VLLGSTLIGVALGLWATRLVAESDRQIRERQRVMVRKMTGMAEVSRMNEEATKPKTGRVTATTPFAASGGWSAVRSALAGLKRAGGAGGAGGTGGTGAGGSVKREGNDVRSGSRKRMTCNTKMTSVVPAGGPGRRTKLR